jgi:hypothetical protein
MLLLFGPIFRNKENVMAWTVDEAFKQHMTSKGHRLQHMNEITKSTITEADRYMLEVFKKTEKMPDSERIKHIHNAIGYIQPFMSKLPAPLTDEIKRLAKLSKTLKKAYLDYCEDTGENPRKKILNTFRTLNFFKLTLEDCWDILETCCFHIGDKDYDTDVHSVRNMVDFLYHLEGSKKKFAKDI